MDNGHRSNRRKLDEAGPGTPPVQDILLATFGIKLPQPIQSARTEEHNSPGLQQEQQQQRRSDTVNRILNIRNDIFRNASSFDDPKGFVAADQGEGAGKVVSYHQPEERPAAAISPVPAADIWPPVMSDRRPGSNRSLLGNGNSPVIAAAQIDELTPLLLLDEEQPPSLCEPMVRLESPPQLPVLVQEEEEEPDVKMEEGKGLIRCNLCPSPGAIAIEDRPVHLDFHREKLFACAACPRRREFESFDEIVCHINISHNVRDSQMVLETILLPEAGGCALRHYKCGVPNCQKSFVAMPEAELRAHIVRTHGEYYVQLGRGRLLRRHCRVCGEDQSFRSEAELDTHISDCHPRDQFAGGLEEPEGAVVVRGGSDSIIEQQKVGSKDNCESLTSGLLMSGFGRRDRALPAAEGGVSSRPASAAVSEADLLPAEPAPIPVFGKPLPAPGNSTESLSDSVGHERGFASATRAVSDSEPEDGELHDLTHKRKKKKKRRRSSGSSSNAESRERKRKISQSSAEDLNKRKTRKFSDESSGSSDGDESVSGASKTSKSRRKRSNKKKVKKSRSSSPAVVKKENEKDSARGRKKTGVKKISFEKIVKKMTPKELKSYLREFKKSQEDPYSKEEEEVVKETLTEDKDKYPTHIRDKKAYYYCLICTEHIGSLKKWNKHRAQPLHREQMEAASEEARRKYNCQEIDLQESVVSDDVFEGTPCAQCRDCYCIFYTRDELTAHLPRGVCNVAAAAGTGVAGHLLSPPLLESPIARPAEPKDFPKFLLSGKLAYYFCAVCSTTVGTLIDWHRHRETVAHLTMRKHFLGQPGTLQQPAAEYQLLAHLRRGNPDHRCLVCQVNCDSGAALWRHFDGADHQTEEQQRAERDWNLMRLIGDRYPDLLHCDVCDTTTTDTPEVHRVNQAHQRALAESEECYFCPAQVRFMPKEAILNMLCISN